jgi:hypothetical protein
MARLDAYAQRDFLMTTVIGIASIKKWRLKVYERKTLLTGENSLRRQSDLTKNTVRVHGGGKGV